MKYVIAVIQSHRLENVRDALVGLGIGAFTAYEVRRFGDSEEHTEFYRAAEFSVGFLPKTKIEFAVSDELADRAVKALRDAATTGSVGDGRIYVLELARTVQIKSGRIDADVAAL
ncbi:MAG TPA: P-II family nitrogen regulator [Hypericibacter adhaerens]|jgi:nitrogen regulatory protein PII|uniref:Nitrogen regulatory protein P-II n=1 Tax=Hypericibacter adhaerens TaxID=2602016 RepID=A0A5J6MXG4_9PROT|nr:P-II family nitrogen regulator [Hypericibacter adhaerens]QEX21395.1 nitrogen regulatory protein P-II [Hypericibacter adhaerens]HWA44711.1 P-II family nitrogen regulator [Hypericibacter adhaerens]